MRWSNLAGRIAHAICRDGKRAACLIAILAPAAIVSASAQAPPAPAAPSARFVVVIDAAHGGDDSGANLDGQPEKSYTLALSVRLRSLLAARGIAVVTTRETDATLAPAQRAQIADHAGAQACLILHASESGFGVHLFTSSLAASRPAVFEPWETAQAAWITRSVALEGVLNSALQHGGMNVTMGRTELPTLDSVTCPAVAVEIAPERGSGQAGGATAAGSLADPNYQAQVADALVAALLEWRAEGSQL
jgi:N-acetylmuramoyl-L-alanine amidase